MKGDREREPFSFPYTPHKQTEGFRMTAQKLALCVGEGFVTYVDVCVCACLSGCAFSK